MFNLLYLGMATKNTVWLIMHFNILPDPDVYIFVTSFLSKVQLSKLGCAPDQSFTSFILKHPIES